MSEIHFKVPNDKETTLISNFILCINKKIEIEELKFKKLESLKKGLMQNMFV